MNVNKSFLSIIFLLSVRICLASTPDDYRHELRFGAGDMLFETLIWNGGIHREYTGVSDGAVFAEDGAYAYSPHFSAEYSYHLIPWLSLGIIADYQNTIWTRTYFSNRGSLYSENENFYNLCLMPVVRFNYFRRKHFGIYSSIAFGAGINGGSEKNGLGQNTVVGIAAELRPLGICAGSESFRGFAEIGGLHSLKSKDFIYLLNSEIVKIGFLYKF